MKLRFEASLPSGPETPQPIRLECTNPDEIFITDVGDGNEATHQIVDAACFPIITHLPHNDCILSAQLARFGYWEFPESFLLSSMAKEGSICFDVGANIGYYSLLLAQAVGPSGTIVSFEPEVNNYLVLLANALLFQERNAEAPTFQTYSSAVSDVVGTAALNIFRDNLAFHSLVHAEGAPSHTTVDTTTIDRVRGLDGEGIPLIRDRVHLIKADIQGGELALLKGASRTLEADHPLLCLELEPYIAGDATCIAVLEELADHGYRNFRLFHANSHAPRATLKEFSRALSVSDVVRLIMDRQVRAYGTIFATHPSGA